MSTMSQTAYERAVKALQDVGVDENTNHVVIAEQKRSIAAQEQIIALLKAQLMSLEKEIALLKEGLDALTASAKTIIGTFSQRKPV